MSLGTSETAFAAMDERAVDPSGTVAADEAEVVLLPYLDGERTPNLPRASGMVAGLSHDITPEEILLAAYEGAAASLVEALDLLVEVDSGLDPSAAILLVGGGARVSVWQRTALGAAVQPAACLSGVAPDELVRGWQTRGGITVEPPDKRELDTLERIHATRDATVADHEG